MFSYIRSRPLTRSVFGCLWCCQYPALRAVKCMRLSGLRIRPALTLSRLVSRFTATTNARLFATATTTTRALGVSRPFASHRFPLRYTAASISTMSAAATPAASTATAAGAPVSSSTSSASDSKADLTVTAKTRIGWVGTGVMGLSQCGHLLKKGYSVVVNTRTKARAQPLLDAGAVWADSPAAVAKASDVVFTMLGFPNDVRDVYLTSPTSILSGIRAGAVVCDMTTTEPSLAKDIAVAFAAKGVHAIDAPVSGGDVGARNATLSIMVGGHKPTLDAIMPLLEVMGKSIVYQGVAGSGQHTKMCNQIVIASTMVGVCESLIYGYRAGLHLETMLQAISGGAAACWTLSNLAPRVLKRNFDPGFYVEHFLKDMGIALDEAKRMKLSLPGLALANQLYISVAAIGHGKKGTHALALALEHMNAVSVQPQSSAAAPAAAPSATVTAPTK